MCGRYLIDEEAYSGILEILYRSGAIPDTRRSTAAQSIPGAMKDAITLAMSGTVPETMPGGISGLFPGTPPVVTNGEVFPTNIAPVIAGSGPMAIKWGFPHRKNSSVIINARSETALEKPMFRKSLLERRCVIPSNGFFEWGNAASGGIDSSICSNIQISMYGSHENFSRGPASRSRRERKIKYLLRRPGDNKLYMAGFWSIIRNGGDEYPAFVILTTAANGSVAPIHGRMPLILSPDERDDWLGSDAFMEYALLRPGPELEAEAA